MERILKNVFLAMSSNRLLNRMARRWGARFGARRVVAGETIDEAIDKVKELNRLGFKCSLDHLGEFTLSEEEAKEATNVCLETLKAIAESGADCNLSVKLTQLGLDIDRRLCLNNMKKIVGAAAQYRNFTRIDMEDYARNEATLEILRELRKTFRNVGVAIQAYLYKSEQDVIQLSRDKVNVRLVKGAYKESPAVAYPRKSDVDENMKKLIELQLRSGSFAAIATHDDRIIEYAKRLARQRGYSRDQFEFQMLYGIRPETQMKLVQEGYAVRVYVPFGKDWYGYFMRRLAERPANLSFALKGMFRK